MTVKLAINGAAGRMGRAVINAATEANLSVVAQVDVGDNLAAAVAACDVLIDFSAPAATEQLLELAIAQRKAVVVGTTGHDGAQREKLRTLAARTRTVWAGNFSIGVNLLFHLVEQAARALPADYDAEIVEMHHRLKKDAPSGTAARLAEIVLAARALGADALVHGRNGLTGERPTAQIGMHALRGGDVVGDHTVIFAATGERIELAHKASDRAIFARGAIRAAQWLAVQPPGLYDMQDVLRLRAAAPSPVSR